MNPYQFDREMQRLKTENHVMGMNWRISASTTPGDWVVNLTKPTATETGFQYEVNVAHVRIRRITQQVFLSEDLHVSEEYRRQGISEKLFKVYYGLVLANGGAILMASVRNDNRAQIARLLKLGWVKTTNYTDEDCYEAGFWFYSPHGFVSRITEGGWNDPERNNDTNT